MSAVPLQEDEFQELRQVCCELRERLRAGEVARVEEFLENHPVLARNDEAVLELIHAEVSTRNDMGQRPTLEEWEVRFPRLLPRMERIVSLRSVFDSEMPTLTDSSAGTAEPRAPEQQQDGRLRIGNYQILQEIGRGGMGVVYRARQANLSRIVALKMILAGEHAGLRERARLRNEAQAAAQLMHPNVVQIFEIGEHEGLPFLAMEYVAGGNLTRTLRAMPQAFRWSARMTETMARAIHVAHQRGIVHRDLNPSNILIAIDGTPKISDFGLAKFLVDDKGLSVSGVILGTPSYMAPEQVSGNGQTIGPAADIYALGALLYEMLTGAAPFRGFTPMETLCQVMEAELVPPSRLRHGVPEDLETICLRCLDRDPARRYASAENLAEDLKRFQENQPIRARRTSKLQQAIQWSHRQPTAARLLGLCFLLLFTLLGVVIAYSLYVTQQNHLAEHNFSQAIKLNSAISIEREKVKFDEGKAARRSYDAQLFQIKQSIAAGEIELAQELFKLVAPTANDSRGFELLYLKRLIERAAWLPEGQERKATSLAVSSREVRLVSGGSSGDLTVWDLDRKTHRNLQGKHNAPVFKVAIVAGDETRRGAIASLSVAGNSAVQLKLWETDTGKPTATLHCGPLQAPDVQFSPDGSWLTLHGLSPDGHEGHSSVWKLNSTGPPTEPPTRIRGSYKLGFSPDSKLLAVGGGDGRVRLHVMAGARNVHEPPVLEQRPGGQVSALAFSRDGSCLAAGRQDRGLTVWDVSTGRILAHYTDQAGPIVFVEFCLDGKALVGWEGTDALWTRTLDQPGSRRLLPGVEDQINSVCLSSDGRLLAAAVRNHPVIVWNLSTGTAERSYLANNRSVEQVEFTSDNRSLILRCKDRLRVWRFRDTPDQPRPLAGHEKEAWALAFSPELDPAHRPILASGSDDHTIKLWDVDSERELLTLSGHSQTVTSLAFFHSDDRLVSVSLDGKVILWDLTRNGPDGLLIQASSRILHAYDDSLRAVSVSSDDHHLAVAGTSGLIHILDATDTSVQADLAGHTGPVYALAYSKHPRVLASASADGSVRWWDPDPKAGSEFGAGNDKRHSAGDMRSVAFTADGLQMAAAGDNRIVTLWSMNSWEVTGTMTGHPWIVRTVAFSPDSRTIATGCDDGKVRLWDTVTGQQFYALVGHSARINAVVFAPDGRTLASCDHKGKILFWKTSDPTVASPVAGH